MQLTSVNYQSPYLGNFFCEIDNYNLAFVAISKNAITNLLSIAIYAKTGYIMRDEDRTHEWGGGNPQSVFLSNYDTYKHTRGKEVVKFAVWRDPVERLVSCYKYFCLEKWSRHYFHFLDLYRDPTFEHFMKFVRFELDKKDALFQDEHIRRQSDFYSPDDVDFIVPIKKLDAFLQNYHVPTQYGVKNSTHTDFKLDNEEYINEIRDLYKTDYEILESTKFF
ncbi:sulfotransferase family protein [Bacteroides xylanisolvens]|uniref:sulfotransferase family 2 domain-containing protein n=1 Tax=Bacteroides xylanisolvens TaxID=371601 RepID=UPI001BA448D2|nr:sulfotransferase family 2 domain-containing protein [Bacteroides xylanisolvens]QUR44519.1 sulfotransferase family protein [Bacteroides xylanisolvens]